MIECYLNNSPKRERYFQQRVIEISYRALFAALSLL